MFVLPLAVQNPNIVIPKKGKEKRACALAVGSMQGMGRKAELCLSNPCHVCGTEAKTEYSGERSTCDATTADGAQEQRNGNVWVPQIFLSVSLGVLVVEGGQESDDSLGGAWGNSSKDLSLLLTCCCHLCSLSFTLHSLRDSEGTAQQP